MHKFIAILGVFALCVGLGLAEEKTVAQLSDAVYDIQRGKDSVNQIQDLRVKDDAVIGDALTVGGAISASGSIAGPVAATTLSAATVTASSGALVTNAYLLANGKTNTLVLAPFGGKYVINSSTTSP